MRAKKAACLLAAIGFSALASTASAEGNNYNWKGRYYGHHYNNYYECYTTPAVEFPGTIVEAAIATPALATLVTAVLAANPAVAEALANPDASLTVYAPTNDAFAAVPILDIVLADQDLLTSILLYHVTAGVKPHYDPRWVNKNAFEVDTLNGQTVFYNRNGGPQINNSNVSCQAVKTTNGVVFVIDSVLLPQFLQPEPAEEPKKD
jgi:uncharacterized surface protein with fasciclin (FAS1) repeats